ncbi:serine/threonine protein phosphatase [Pseudooceanicola sp. CBS1P-1]|uniref:Serine/threonine protein phosphatase n=1 Tax=Pseudooceanicola albus TaxID=2692189 RepID=A0A6L7FXX7_9RHOB|nr:MULTISPECIES: metallophosphoesterase family protein [Pseudooceanicola]MBT9383973.1 serine/threonine protein phosphatase [Pseudooceanicola endophyticus]MXN16615.1 serine/threonine protein phosphatase [Pseudooceanicola albus]
MTIYAIGDIHGQLGMLEAALARVAADGAGPGDEVIFLGDLVDRGPQSRAVLDLLIAGRAAGRNWTILRGNHDEMFRAALDEGQLHHPAIKSGRSWFDPALGGPETLKSYGVDMSEGRSIAEILAEARARVPESHRTFLRATPLWAERADVLFVHAGLRPGVALSDQVIADLTWIREPFYAVTEPFPWLIVHGHTVVDVPSHFGNRIDLDTGAGARPAPRHLTVAAFEGRDCFILTDQGRQPLLPDRAHERA